MKRKWRILLITAMLLVVAGCSACGTLPAQATQEQPGEARTQDASHMANIILVGDTASADGSGVTIDGHTVTITQGGVYTLSGMFNGQVIVDAGKHDTVELILRDVSITSPSGAAIDAVQAGMTILTLPEGTRSTLADATAGESDGETNAAVYARDDLYVRGEGMLTVYGNRQNGMSTKDSLTIVGGTLVVQAQNNGLRGKDAVVVLGGSLTITAGNDGIQADNDSHSGSGTVTIEGGDIRITAANDGIQAQTALTIAGGTIDILAGGGHITETFSGKQSYKALKSYGAVAIAGGVIHADSLDDAIHAGTTVSITGGVLTLATRDDAVHANEAVTITGGVIHIDTCYEGIESAIVNISGGEIDLLAEDDGINAVDASQNGQGDTMSGSEGGMGAASLQVHITGGVIRCNTYGDGIDSNGSVIMSGGALYVSGPLSKASGALDYDDSFVISGGVLAAAGSIGMAQTPSANSGQASVIVYFAQFQSAGSTYLLTDSSGTVLLRFAPEKEYQCIVFSAPELIPGNNFRLYTSTDGTLNSATLLYDFAITDTLTVLGGGQAQPGDTR